MRIPIRHKLLSWLLITLSIITFAFSWFIYYEFKNFQNIYLKNKVSETLNYLKKIQKIENIYIAKSFFLSEYTKNIIDIEDKDLIKNEVIKIKKLSFYEGAVFIKGDKIIYKDKTAPNIDYIRLVKLSKKYPHTIFSTKYNKDFWGLSIFSLYGKDDFSTPYAFCILYFNWKHFIDKKSPIFSIFSVSLGENEDKEATKSIPLNSIDNSMQAYLNFKLSKETSYFRYLFVILLIVLNVTIGVLTFPWILYLTKEKKYILEMKKILDNLSKNATLEEVLDLTTQNLYTHKLYKKCLETAISTRSIKETLRVLVSTLSEMTESKYWAIILTSFDFKEWKFFLWSIGVDTKCLDETLDILKKQDFKKLKIITKLKKVYLLDDINEVEILKDIKCILDHHIKSISIIPMIVNDNIIGILVLAWDRKREFNSYGKTVFENVKDMIRDILESAYNIHEMFWLSYKDPLLDIYNRRILEDIAKKEHKGSLLCLDLDNFKNINDKYGHDTGDKVLKEFTLMVKDLLRDEDIFLRYGGDEFIIYLKNADKETAEKIAQRIKKKIKEKFLNYGLSVSIGISELDENTTIYGKIAETDRKMYEEKKKKHIKP